jgi:hypothetical protein
MEKRETNKSIILSIIDISLSLQTKMKSGSCKSLHECQKKDFALVVRCQLVLSLVNENAINISM